MPHNYFKTGIFAIGFKETQSILFGLQAVMKAIYYAALGMYIAHRQPPCIEL